MFRVQVENHPLRAGDFNLLEFKAMKQLIKIFLMIGLPVIGLIAGYLLMVRTVQAQIDGVAVSIRTRALTVGGALRSAGFNVTENDSVLPSDESWLSKAGTIKLDRARSVRFLGIPGNEELEVFSAALTPAAILEQAGFTPGDQDSVILDGLLLTLTEKLPQGRDLVLAYKPAVKVMLTLDGSESTITSSAESLGVALWQAGIRLRDGDRVSPGLNTPPVEGLKVEIHTGRSLSISVDGATIQGYSAAPAVAEALAESGVILQDVDFTQPGADEPLPEDGVIRVIRVTEEILSEQRVIPFDTESLADNSMFMNETRVSQAGEYGLAATRVKVRYEDGVEAARETQDEVILYQPVNQVEYYGTKLLENFVDTPEGPLKYYLAVDVVATSYSPCRLGVEGLCSNITASGRILQKGIVAFKRDWFNLFRDTRVFVPGYGIGIVADKGTYPYSDRWIDLGYTDADYVPWGAVKVTIYFLSPPPAGFTGVLP